MAKKDLEATIQEHAETIAKYENILEHMQEMAHIGWWEFDVLQGKITWTKAVFEMHGLDPAQGEPSYEDLLKITHPDDADYFNTTVGRALQFGEPYKITYRVIQPTGQTHRLYVQSQVRQNDEGQTVWLLGIVMDITERDQAEIELRQMAMTIEQTTDGIAIADLEGYILFANPAWANMHGYQSDELPGKHLGIFHTEEQVKNEVAPFNEQVMKTGSHQGEVGHVKKDGTIFPTWMTSTILKDEAGNPIGLTGTARDITEQKQAETERDQLQQEIIEAQQRALKELSTPVIPIMDRIIVMPLVGSIDSMRAKDIMRTLLAGIRRHRAKVVILDITGVAIVDSGVAGHLDKTIQAARLKGARTIITGISDAVAETIVDLGIDWNSLETLSDLQTGLIVALNSLGVRLSKS